VKKSSIGIAGHAIKADVNFASDSKNRHSRESGNPG
jgi:hypothetical protein